jgi:hypothetical protein
MSSVTNKELFRFRELISLKMPMVARASMMSLGTWSARSTKYQKFLNLANVFLLISSTILIFCATILISWYHMLKLEFWSSYFYWTPMLMLVLGLYTFGTCMYGFIISVRESRGLIMVMAILLSFAFVGQLGSCFTALKLRTHLKIYPVQNLVVLENMALYNIDDTVTANWDSMQSNLRCCGGNRYEDGYTTWEDAAGKTNRTDKAPGASLSVPDSCCHHDVQKKDCGKSKIKDKIRLRGTDIGIWKDGCVEILKQLLKRDLNTFSRVYIGVGLLLALVELITVVIACAYVAQINR